VNPLKYLDSLKRTRYNELTYSLARFNLTQQAENHLELLTGYLYVYLFITVLMYITYFIYYNNYVRPNSYPIVL